MQWLYSGIQETALRIYKFLIVILKKRPDILYPAVFLIYNLFIQLIAWGRSRMSIFNSSFRWNDKMKSVNKEIPNFQNWNFSDNKYGWGSSFRGNDKMKSVNREIPAFAGIGFSKPTLRIIMLLRFSFSIWLQTKYHNISKLYISIPAKAGISLLPNKTCHSREGENLLNRILSFSW
jgi:hypothetical protein